MGNCCPLDNSDSNPPKDTSAQKSPNSKAKNQRPQPDVNPFKPGARDVRIVQNEETGKLEKTKYKPPNDPNAVKAGEAQSLVSFSIMNAQQKDINERENKPVNNYGAGASFQQTTVLANSN